MTENAVNWPKLSGRLLSRSNDGKRRELADALGPTNGVESDT